MVRSLGFRLLRLVNNWLTYHNALQFRKVQRNKIWRQSKYSWVSNFLATLYFPGANAELSLSLWPILALYESSRLVDVTKCSLESPSLSLLDKTPLSDPQLLNEMRTCTSFTEIKTHRLATAISEEGRKLSVLTWTSLHLKKKWKIPSLNNSIVLAHFYYPMLL